jgi:putative polyhydroxyalkanoate system protein
MSQILVRRRHGLPMAEARHLAETMARRLRDDFGGSYAWEGDTLRFQRTGASGHVAVTPDGFEIRVDLSFVLRPLHGRIEREIVSFCDENVTPPAGSPQAVPAARRRRAARSSRSHGSSRSERPK